MFVSFAVELAKAPIGLTSGYPIPSESSLLPMPRKSIDNLSLGSVIFEKIPALVRLWVLSMGKRFFGGQKNIQKSRLSFGGRSRLGGQPA